MQQDMQESLLVSQQAGVLTLTMNRPEVRNALDLPMSARLVEVLREAQVDPAVRVVVLTGAAGAFCAGGDVKAMASGRDRDVGFEERAQRLRERADASRLLHEMPKPTVALIPGAAAGAGLALALACDFRLAQAGAKLALAFSRVGLAGDYGISWFLTHTVGAVRAREWLMLAPIFTAEQALAEGLVNRVFAADDYEQECQRFVATLAEGPALAYAYIKRNVDLASTSSLGPSLDTEAVHQARCMFSEDHREAAKAFADKRTPRFNGR
jgi:2-(1,2-epoxy-1,2-dihydrophenyl)acetyl-CoA isomerase